MNNSIKYKVEQNKKYKDFRVVKYVNGEWVNERDNNWNKNQATVKCKKCNDALKNGIEIF